MAGRWCFRPPKAATPIFTVDAGTGGKATRLTTAPSIETAPSFSPDGSQIVFESDRTGGQQIYVMPAGGGEPRRISARAVAAMAPRSGRRAGI
jgi:Tol biopolymer transport system component